MRYSWIYTISMLLLMCGIGVGGYYQSIKLCGGSMLAFVAVILIMSFQMKCSVDDADYENSIK